MVKIAVYFGPWTIALHVCVYVCVYVCMYVCVCGRGVADLSNVIGHRIVRFDKSVVKHLVVRIDDCDLQREWYA